MAEIIEVEFRVTWRIPVNIRVRDGFRERIYGPDDAMDCLSHSWPPMRGEKYLEARRECIATLCKRSSLELSRQKFIEAGEEAGVLD